MLVRRRDRAKRTRFLRSTRWSLHTRWSFFFANKPRLAELRRILCQVIAQDAKLILQKVSTCRVDCVWPKAVSRRRADFLLSVAETLWWNNVSVETWWRHIRISEGEAASGAQEKEETEEVAEPQRKKEAFYP